MTRSLSLPGLQHAQYQAPACHRRGVWCAALPASMCLLAPETTCAYNSVLALSLGMHCQAHQALSLLSTNNPAVQLCAQSSSKTNSSKTNPVPLYAAARHASPRLL